MRALLERDLARILEAALRELEPRVLWYHTHDSRRSAEGWPDYAISVPGQPGQLLFVEIKKAGGSPTARQVEWLLAIAAAMQPAILAGGAAGISSVVELVRGMAKGRRLTPAALGRVVVFGDISPSGRALVGAAADDSMPSPRRAPGTRRRRSGW